MSGNRTLGATRESNIRSDACKRYQCEQCEVTKCSECSVTNHVYKSHGDDECKVIEIIRELCKVNTWLNVCYFKCDECSFEPRGKLSLKCHKDNTHRELEHLVHFVTNVVFRQILGGCCCVTKGSIMLVNVLLQLLLCRDVRL